MGSKPKYGLRLGDKGEWLTNPRRVIAVASITTADPKDARTWSNESSAYSFRSKNPDLKKRGFIVRPIISEPASV
jgi:hypothetical protein